MNIKSIALLSEKEITAHGFNIKETKIENEQQDWNLLYDNNEQLDDAFFKTLSKVELVDVLIFIGDRIRIWNGFTHMKDRYTKRKNLLS